MTEPWIDEGNDAVDDAYDALPYPRCANCGTRFGIPGDEEIVCFSCRLLYLDYYSEDREEPQQ